MAVATKTQSDSKVNHKVNSVAKTNGEPKTDPKKLTVEETKTLQQCEASIQNGFEAAGKALKTIREQKLYRAEFDTFEAYCNARWGLVRQTINKMIGAAEVMENLRKEGIAEKDLPKSTRAAAELATGDTANDPKKQAQAWKAATKGGKKGSAKAVAKATGKDKPTNDIKSFQKRIDSAIKACEAHCKLFDMVEVLTKAATNLRNRLRKAGADAAAHSGKAA
jgi:hypothetical protein